MIWPKRVLVLYVAIASFVMFVTGAVLEGPTLGFLLAAWPWLIAAGPLGVLIGAALLMLAWAFWEGIW